MYSTVKKVVMNQVYIILQKSWQWSGLHEIEKDKNRFRIAEKLDISYVLSKFEKLYIGSAYTDVKKVHKFLAFTTVKKFDIDPVHIRVKNLDIDPAYTTVKRFREGL